MAFSITLKDEGESFFDIKNKTISQIKNIHQRDIGSIEKEKKQKGILIEINSFEKLIDICNKRKEIKLKYELETNVNLVSFENKRIEISFNDHLDKEFIKEMCEVCALREAWGYNYKQNKHYKKWIKDE